jgi:hypothetical protein
MQWMLPYILYIIFTPSVTVAQTGGTENSIGEHITREVIQNKKYLLVAYQELIYQRCFRYYGAAHPAKVIYDVTPTEVIMMECSKVSNDFIKAIDYDQEYVTFADVSFTLRLIYKSKLIALLNSNATSKIFEKILKDADQSYFNLYESVKSITNSADLTTEFIAVLFQDYSNQKLHFQFINYLAENKKISVSAVGSDNSLLWEKVLFKLLMAKPTSLTLGRNGDYITQFNQFYPIGEALNTETNESFAYHYYVPRYLAQTLQKTYKNSPYTSYIAAFSFNYFHEIFLTFDFQLLTWSSFLHALSITDPKIPTIYKATDIYLGHMGSLHSLGMNKKTLSFKEFTELLKSEPTKAYVKSVQFIGSK